jgi:hypothetical protein
LLLKGFNWKEKKELGLISNEGNGKPTPLELIGDFSLLSSRLLADTTNSFVSFENVQKADLVQFKDALDKLQKTRPRLSVPSLFGSNKSYGFCRPIVGRRHALSTEGS